MCGTIDPGSCIRWVLGFGIKNGYDRFWELWFYKDHHVASLFIVRRPILKKEIKHFRINLSLTTWFFFLLLFHHCQSLRISTWSWLEQLCHEPVTMDFFGLYNQESSSCPCHLDFLFNKYQHLELCDSPWFDWYLGLKHSLALLYHIWYLTLRLSLALLWCMVHNISLDEQITSV
jgi:hypothetical protein